jgi:hypothetical protein
MSKDLKFFTPKKKEKKFPGFWSRLVAFEIDANKKNFSHVDFRSYYNTIGTQ